MKIETIIVGALEVNCLLLIGEDDHAVVVDPGADPERIAAFIQKRQLTIDGWLLTHGHVDHLYALAPLVDQFPAPVHMHPQDASWAFTAQNQIPPLYPAPSAPTSEIKELREGQHLRAAGIEMTILETPGHTPGCICLYMPDADCIITGDTLFAGSAGRTDLPGGNPNQLVESLRRLAALPDDCRVYPGHGPATTIATEKRVNPFMQYRPTEV